MEFQELIKRINELYHKSKEEGLTEAELAEQANLRKQYRAAVLGNFSSQLDGIKIQHADGSIEPLKSRKKKDD
ncbi:MAG: DUF896 domain-containing protein [Clostridia bacterium]|nr:DUF896 domain-containing protein [Clostridia bacterium]